MLKWWMRVVGAFYLLKFVVVVFVKAPIRELAPDGIARAAAGDPVGILLVDTWVIFGLEMAALGIALLVASRAATAARALVAAVLAVEVSGIAADVYQLVRGHAPGVQLTWIAIHLVILGLGLAALRRGHGDALHARAVA